MARRIIMIDDSIVRGTTSDRIVKMLRDAGAKEVHVQNQFPAILMAMLFWYRCSGKRTTDCL